MPKDSRMSTKVAIRIAVTATAKTIIEKLSDQTGLKEIAIASRLYEWFAGQDDAVRASILGTIPESMRTDVARIWMERESKRDNGNGKKKAG